MSLRRKITVLLLLTMGAVAAAQIVFTGKLERTSRTAELRREAAALSHAITSSVGQTLQDQLLIAEYLQRALDQFGRAPGVLAIRIYDQHGKLVTQKLGEAVSSGDDPLPHAERIRKLMQEGNVVREVAAEGRRYDCLVPMFPIRSSQPRLAHGLVEVAYRVANPEEPKTLLLDDFADAVTMSISAIWDLRTSQSTWLATLAEQLAEHEDIESIEVYDNQSRVVAHSIPGRVGTRPPPTHVSSVRQILDAETDESQQAVPRQLNRFVPIHAPDSGDGDAPVGVFGLTLNTDRIDARVAESRNRQVGFTLVVFSATGLFLLFAVSRLVTQPLHRIATATAQVADGELDPHIENSRHDEIGNLARAFNSMVSRVNENIHRREIAEQELRHANEELEQRVETRTAELRLKDQAIQSSGAGVVLGTPDGRVTEANPAFARMWGFASTQELVGRSAMDFSADRIKVDEIMQTAQRDGYWMGEDLARKKDGTQFPIELTVSVVKDKDDRPVATMATFIDITQRRKAEDAQRKQVDFTRSILAALTSHVSVLNQNGEIVEVNEAWNRFARDNGDEELAHTGLGANYLQICRQAAATGDDLAALAADGIEGILNGSRQSFSLEYPCHSPTQRRWFIMNATPMSNEDRGVVISHTNISVRKLAEQALQESQDRLRAIVENAADGIVAIDQQGVVEEFSQAAERMFGYGSQEVIGQNVSLLMPAPHGDRHDAYIRSYLKTGRKRMVGIGREVEGKRKDGTVVPLRVSISEIPGESRRFIGVLHDVTERKEAERRLLQSARLSAIGEAMAGLTHESRNALARSQANLQRLKRRIKNRPDCHDFIDAALRAQKDLQHLFDEVRQYAAPLHLRFEECDLYGLIETTWRELDESRQGRIVTFRHEQPGFPTVCAADSFAIRQVFRNILENSVQACRDTVKIEVRHTVRDFRSAPAIQIHIRDNGPGFTLAEAAKIFDAFYTTKTHGTGLGLAICRRILTEHHGTIGVGATEGPGAEFVLTLPRTQP